MRTSPTTAASCPTSLGSSARRLTPYTEPVIYCVIPRDLEESLYEKMVEYYKDNPNVTVIMDRREGPDRRAGEVSADHAEQRVTRDRRRARVTGTFPDTDLPSSTAPGE
jgi:hypothetical protein